jgi:hypothetical protein
MINLLESGYLKESERDGRMIKLGLAKSAVNGNFNWFIIVFSGGPWCPVLHCECLRPPLGAQDLPCHAGCYGFPRSTRRPQAPPTCGFWRFCKSSLFILSDGFDTAQFRLTVQLVKLLLHIQISTRTLATLFTTCFHAGFLLTLRP